MRYRDGRRLVLAAMLTVLGGVTAVAADKPAVDQAAVNKAFEALKTYDWGKDYSVLKPIDDAVVATHGDAAARKNLETRLAAVLKTNVSRDAKDYVCRKLMVIGSAESVPTLAGLLPNKGLSHMARYALERIPAPEAAQALRDALPRLRGALKVGVIGSLGVRRDAASVPALVALLGDADKAVARAAAYALGDIGSLEAAKALGQRVNKRTGRREAGRSWMPIWSAPSGCWPTARRPTPCISTSRSIARASPSRCALAAVVRAQPVGVGRPVERRTSPDDCRSGGSQGPGYAGRRISAGPRVGQGDGGYEPVCGLVADAFARCPGRTARCLGHSGRRGRPAGRFGNARGQRTRRCERRPSKPWAPWAARPTCRCWCSGLRLPNRKKRPPGRVSSS